jgi:hypothetical protein
MSVNVNDYANGITRAAGITRPTAGVSTNITAGGVDCIHMDGPMGCVVNVGTVVGTETVFTGKVQEAPNITSGYTDLTTVPLSITSTTGVPGISVVNFVRTQRFVRFMGTITGTTAAVALDVVFEGRNKQG